MQSKHPALESSAKIWSYLNLTSVFEILFYFNTGWNFVDSKTKKCTKNQVLSTGSKFSSQHIHFLENYFWINHLTLAAPQKTRWKSSPNTYPVLWRQISSAYKIHRDQHGTRLEQSTNLYVTLKALEKFLTNWEKTGNNLEMSPPVKISFIKGFKLVLLLELVWSWSTSCDWSCRCCKKTFSHKYLSNQ